MVFILFENKFIVVLKFKYIIMGKIDLDKDENPEQNRNGENGETEKRSKRSNKRMPIENLKKIIFGILKIDSL